MEQSRRQFVTRTSLAVLAAAAASRQGAANPADTPAGSAPSPPPDAPSAFATSPAAGPDVSPSTFTQAQKLVRVELTEAELKEAADSWPAAMAPLYERRTGLDKVSLETTDGPALR